jgi:hypothetical protein
MFQFLEAILVRLKNPLQNKIIFQLKGVNDRILALIDFEGDLEEQQPRFDYP